LPELLVVIRLLLRRQKLNIKVWFLTPFDLNFFLFKSQRQIDQRIRGDKAYTRYFSAAVKVQECALSILLLEWVVVGESAEESVLSVTEPDSIHEVTLGLVSLHQ
jgi:hypothetical protein